jgi:hypothetical protein
MKGICQISGENAELTKEHLPQKSFYPKAIRTNIKQFNTVLACAKCNNESNVSDELAKVVFGLVSDTPWQDQLRKSVNATLLKNNRLRRLLDENMKEKTVALNDGSKRGARVFKLPRQLNEELLSAVERMVKAFYFMRFGRILVEHYELSVFHPEAIHPSLAEKLRDEMMHAEVHGVNEDTVLYTFLNPQSNDVVCVINLFATVQLFFVIKEFGWREKTE